MNQGRPGGVDEEQLCSFYRKFYPMHLEDCVVLGDFKEVSLF